MTEQLLLDEARDEARATIIRRMHLHDDGDARELFNAGWAAALASCVPAIVERCAMVADDAYDTIHGLDDRSIGAMEACADIASAIRREFTKDTPDDAG